MRDSFICKKAVPSLSKAFYPFGNRETGPTLGTNLLLFKKSFFIWDGGRKPDKFGIYLCYLLDL